MTGKEPASPYRLVDADHEKVSREWDRIFEEADSLGIDEDFVFSAVRSAFEFLRKTPTAEPALKVGKEQPHWIYPAPIEFDEDSSTPAAAILLVKYRIWEEGNTIFIMGSMLVSNYP